MRTTVPAGHDVVCEKLGHHFASGVSTGLASFFFGASPSLRAFRAVIPACLRRTELALADARFSPRKAPRHRIAALLERRSERILPAPGDNPSAPIDSVQGALQLAYRNFNDIAFFDLAFAHEACLGGIDRDDPPLDGSILR